MGSQNYTKKFKWTPQRTHAAQLLAADELTDEQIASEVSVTRRALSNWKLHPTFKDRVESIQAEWREKLRLEGLANRQNRIDQLDDINRRMLAVIHDRAQADGMVDVPGGQTGLLVHQQKAIGVGHNQQIIDEYAVDTGLIRELRAHTEQIAKEVGQWTEKREVNGRLAVQHQVDLSELTDDELDLLERIAQRATESGSDQSREGSP